VRNSSLIAFAAFLIAGCGAIQPEPIIYAERVSVHSVLPVHVRMHEAYELTAAGTGGFEFDTDYQYHFVESLKSELVNHGVFGSISDTGGDDIFEVDVNFARVSSFPEANHYKLTVALVTAYRGERDFNQYHVLFIEEEERVDDAPIDTGTHHRTAATELMSLIMGDIQQAIADRKVSLKAHVKEDRVEIPRMLVKW